jgi:trimeric autotransporter adhesin
MTRGVLTGRVCALLVMALGSFQMPAHGQTACAPAWVPTFGHSPGAGLDGSAESLATFDDGTGPALYAGGSFKTANGVNVLRIAKWDGTHWAPVGNGLDNVGGVLSMASFDDGSGNALYVGGTFETASGVPAPGIAKWNGSTWSGVGGGLTGGFLLSVWALAVFDDGSGPALYATGNFDTAGGVVVHHVARWNGSSWSALGSGLGADALGHALAVFDDGSGPALYVGGTFSSAGGVPVAGLARWNGSTWSAVGDLSGTGGFFPPEVLAMAVVHETAGTALYVGGGFLHAGSIPVANLLRWDGSAWSDVGGGVKNTSSSSPVVTALAAFNDGSGTALHVGGMFNKAGTISAANIAKWNGTSWSRLGNGVNGAVDALASVNDGSGPALIAAGDFTNTPDSADSHVAKWKGCPLQTWNDLGFALPGAGGAPLLEGTGTLEPGTSLVLSLTHAAPSSASVLLLSDTSIPAPFKGGTLVPVPALFALPLMTDAAGAIVIPYAAWPAGASGLSLYFQYAIQDGGAIGGIALSNALRADVP